MDGVTFIYIYLFIFGIKENTAFINTKLVKSICCDCLNSEYSGSLCDDVKVNHINIEGC